MENNYWQCKIKSIFDKPVLPLKIRLTVCPAFYYFIGLCYYTDTS